MTVAVALLSAAVGARAGYVGPAVTVEVRPVGQDGPGALVEVPLELTTETPAGRRYTMLQPLTLISGQHVLATLETLTVELVADPESYVSFVMGAGSEDVTFTINSGVVAFDPLTNAYGYATADVTVTDLNGDGATLTPMGTGGFGCLAVTDLGDWTGLVGDTLVADPNGIASVSERYPAAGWGVVPGTISWIQSRASWQVSAYDKAEGSTRFEVSPEPEPATMGLLGLGLAGMMAKRKRRRT